MADRWTIGLMVAAVFCCAAPLLIGAGLAGAAWAALRDHWGWVVLALGGVAWAAWIPAASRRRRRRQQLQE